MSLLSWLRAVTRHKTPAVKPGTEWGRVWAVLEDPFRPDEDPCVVNPRTPHQGKKRP